VDPPCARTTVKIFPDSSAHARGRHIENVTVAPRLTVDDESE